MLAKLILFLLLLPTFVTAQNVVTYQSSNEDFPNPERGFYYPSVTLDNGSMNAAPSVNFINGLRNEYTPFNANYQVHSTLLYRYFDLDNYIDTNNPNNIVDIAPAYLVTLK